MRRRVNESFVVDVEYDNIDRRLKEYHTKKDSFEMNWDGGDKWLYFIALGKKVLCVNEKMRKVFCAPWSVPFATKIVSKLAVGADDIEITDGKWTFWKTFNKRPDKYMKDFVKFGADPEEVEAWAEAEGVECKSLEAAGVHRDAVDQVLEALDNGVSVRDAIREAVKK